MNASASDLLFAARARGPGADTYYDVDVFHATTGALLKTLDIWPVTADVLSTNSTGTRLFVTDALNGTFAFDVGPARSLRATGPTCRSRVPSGVRPWTNTEIA